MAWVLLAAVAWFAVATVVALVLGRSIRLADDRSRRCVVAHRSTANGDVAPDLIALGR